MTTERIETTETTETMEALPCMKTHCDGAHCGLTDWYPEIERGIKQALRRGRWAEWTTGWYASKKEIASACIEHTDGEIWVDVSVSDDLDTDGRGQVVIPHTRDLEKIRKAIFEAWELAEQNQKGNRQYYGFKILHKRKLYPTYIGGKPAGRGRMMPVWVETYLLPRIPDNDIFGIPEFPPGDNYHQWYWQGECEISEEVKQKLAEWAQSHTEGHQSFTYRGWTIEPWE